MIVESALNVTEQKKKKKKMEKGNFWLQIQRHHLLEKGRKDSTPCGFGVTTLGILNSLLGPLLASKRAGSVESNNSV